MWFAISVIIIILVYSWYKQYKAAKLNLTIIENWMLIAVHKLGAKTAATTYLEYVGRSSSYGANPVLKSLCKAYGMSQAWINDEAGGIEKYNERVSELADRMARKLKQFELDDNSDDLL